MSRQRRAHHDGRPTPSSAADPAMTNEPGGPAGVLVSLNVLLLLFIAFQPFPTNVLGTCGDQHAAVVLYAATLAATGLVVLALWLYATGGRRLVRRDLDARLVRHHIWRALSAPFIFLLSIGIAQVSPLAAELSCIAIAPVWIPFRRSF